MSTPPQGGRDLPWLILGRRVRPFSLGLSLACLVVFWTDIFKRSDAGDVFDGSAEGLVLGGAAALCVVLLWWAYWAKNDLLMRWGLLGATGVFSARAAFLLFDRGWEFTPMWISVSIMTMAGGAWLLEQAGTRG